MIRMHKATLIIGLLLAMSCAQEPPRQEQPRWFDLPGTLHEVIDNTVAASTAVEKTFILNGRQEQHLYEPADTAFLHAELSKILQVDLNGLGYREALQVRQAQPDTASNLLYDEYRPAPGNHLPLVFVRVYYLQQPTELRRLSLLLERDNLLAGSRWQADIWLNRYNNRLLIDSVCLHGADNMLWQKPRQYTITLRRVVK